MRTCLAIAVVILLAPLSASAQLEQPTKPSKTSEAGQSRSTAQKTHKTAVHGDKTEHHSRKIGTGNEIDNSHPPVFGDDQGSGKPKPKP